MTTKSESTPTIIHVSRDAYVKSLSHALRHPSASVIGVVIGERTPELRCCIALPLLHSQLYNTPLLTLGFNIAEKIALAKGMEILGVYFANSNGTIKLSTLQQCIASRVHTQTGKPSVVLMIDTKGLQSSTCCVVAAQYGLNNIHSSTMSITLEDEAISELENVLLSGNHLNVSDLEDHTLNPHQNPMQSLVKKMEL